MTKKFSNLGRSRKKTEGLSGILSKKCPLASDESRIAPNDRSREMSGIKSRTKKKSLDCDSDFSSFKTKFQTLFTAVFKSHLVDERWLEGSVRHIVHFHEVAAHEEDIGA